MADVDAILTKLLEDAKPHPFYAQDDKPGEKETKLPDDIVVIDQPSVTMGTT